MVKVIIIGGGFAGLSSATILSNNPNIEITIYEKENELGGQASSVYNKNCNIEHSWRIFGTTYHNLWYIFNNILHISNNFKLLNNICLVNSNSVSKGTLGIKYILPQILNSTKYSNYYKYFDFLFLCKDRVISDYDNINAYEYFDKMM